MSEKVKIGRLAMRKEGTLWVAYYADNDTMEGALWLGAIHMGAASIPEYKERFMALMRDVVSHIITDATDATPDWGGPESAPEHERSGEA